MSGFDFRDLNLSSVEVSSGSSILQPGKHVVSVLEAKVSPTKANDGSKALAIKVGGLNGEGTLSHWINLYSAKSPKATEIGREELKSLLVWGGHPTPNHPGDVASIVGLKVGVIVRANEYTKDGQVRTGSEIAKFIDPADVDPANFTPKAIPAVAPATGNFGAPF